MEFNIATFDRYRVLVVGDLMMDEYLWGDVDRISPEAPVQVVAVNREEFTLGGSGNVVNNLAALGARVSAVGVIGTGSDGRLLLEQFNALGVNAKGIIQEPNRPTTRKTRIIAAHQHVLRIDRETRKEISGDNFVAMTKAIIDQIPKVDVVLISDYGKGVVTPTLIAKIVETAKKHNRCVIADPKGLDFTKYAGVSLITPNRKEAALAAGVEITDNAGLVRAAEKILSAVNIKSLLITCGSDGMVLFEKNKPPYRIKSKARQVFDVSGAGDTVLSTFGLAVAAGLSFKQSANIANTAAGIVVGKLGTATISQKELTEALSGGSDSEPPKFVPLDKLEPLIAGIREKGQKIVLTNGCFDFLHAGHIKLFSTSRRLGDVLIVAIDDDQSVRTLKGEGRPVIDARQRIQILSALDSINHVVLFSSDELDRLIELIRPDILTKGSNYASDEVTGHQLVEKLGGRVEMIPIDDRISSSRIINTIKKNH
ncbi:MAG: D-glycero-beta-D-manno-heptose-7-phosphate kinase [Deltaproteobacteria bacterium]|nr:D-glycero-beta-D-manno-heptose-7-phosphate kinase [Deltaproteobacteria bacterium]